MKNNLIRYLCLFTLLLIATHLLPAQQLATLNVTVSDPSGKLVAGARITLNNAGNGIARNQVTDRSGFAVLTALSAGDYHLKVQADGFSDYERPHTLTVGQVASVSAQLGIAAFKQNIAVSESSSVIVDT